MDVSLLVAEDFLEFVWGDRKGWIDLPSKVAGYWVPWYYLWEGDADVTFSRRIDSCLADGESLYFSAAQFTRRGRLNDRAMGSSWLWADLDEVIPQEAGRKSLLPTVAWETSPGRYQALWKLEQKISPGALEKLNRALSYHLGADPGGWDLAQVLRLPGTRNFKYPGAPPVKLLWFDEDLRYDAKDIWSRVKHHHQELGRADPSIPRKPLPARAGALLRVPADSVVEGERSARMWEIECLLAESGWGEDEIVGVVGECAWNKWASVRTGDARLRREVRKAIQHVRRQRLLQEDDAGEDEGTEQSVEPALPFIRYASFMALRMEEPKWLIEGIWGAQSHGIIGGEPKTAKTTLALAMGLSVASGKPFLGEYPVHTVGPVLMIQEENAPWIMQDRLRKIASSYELIRQSRSVKAPEGSLYKHSIELDFPDDVPFRILNNFGFNLTAEEHQKALETEIQAIKPALVILDPMYLIFGGADYNQARELYPYLAYLKYLHYEYNTAVLVIHHYRKWQASNGGPQVGGQRLMGNATLHGWVDSAFYVEKLSEDDESELRVKLTREFRNVAPRKPIEISLSIGDPGDLQFSATTHTFNVASRIYSMVQQDEGVTARSLAEALGMEKNAILRYARGHGGMIVKSTRRGRGFTHQIYIDGSSNGKS